MLLWLWHRPVATVPIGPLAWELPYAAGAALKRQNQKQTNKKNVTCVSFLKDNLTLSLDEEVQTYHITSRRAGLSFGPSGRQGATTECILLLRLLKLNLISNVFLENYEIFMQKIYVRVFIDILVARVKNWK